jgi:hypothetical protein
MVKVTGVVIKSIGVRSTVIGRIPEGIGIILKAINRMFKVS